MSKAQGIAQSANQGQFKNRILNGDCRIDQRNAGAAVTGILGSIFSVDRWKNYNSQASKLTLQQNAGSVTPPVGFTSYLGVTSSSAYSVGSTDEFDLFQNIEGLNVADLGWGTANAQPVTLSFWVRSSLTGTFGGSLRNSDANRSYPFSYTISSANTWEQKSITIAGDTTGTWLTTNGVGIGVFFSMGAGSSLIGTAGAWVGANRVGATGQTNLVGTNGATFYITGVQLEKGSTATSFDYRPYGTELALCQRYYAKLNNDGSGNYAPVGFGRQQATTNSTILINYPVTMRAEPTFSYSNLSISDLANYETAITGLASSSPGYNNAILSVSSAAVGGQNISTFLYISNNTSGFLAMTAEL